MVLRSDRIQRLSIRANTKQLAVPLHHIVRFKVSTENCRTNGFVDFYAVYFDIRRTGLQGCRKVISSLSW